jgi:hypothetical protein
LGRYRPVFTALQPLTRSTKRRPGSSRGALEGKAGADVVYCSAKVNPTGSDWLTFGFQRLKEWRQWQSSSLRIIGSGNEADPVQGDTIMKTLLLGVAAILVLSTGAARADDDYDCRGVAKDKRMTASAIEQKARGMGIDVRKVETDDGCYEVHAIDMNGDDFEIYMHPETAKIIGVDD